MNAKHTGGVSLACGTDGSESRCPWELLSVSVPCTGKRERSPCRAWGKNRKCVAGMRGQLLLVALRSVNAVVSAPTCNSGHSSDGLVLQGWEGGC